MSSERSLTPPPPTTSSANSSSVINNNNRKRSRGLMDTDPLLHAAFTAIAQFCTQHNYHATASSLLQQGIIPTEDQLLVWVPKALHDRPPWVHWSKADMAPQLKCPDVARCSVTPNVWRGYRMARASQAAESGGGAYYYEVLIQPGPSAKEIAAAMPPSARLGPGFKEQLETALRAEERQQQQQQQQGDENTNHNNNNSGSGSSSNSIPSVGGHVRLGWSMRTGDLQGPVGYDKWSYGIRDQGGSIVHRSQRQDEWGGVEFGPGDVIGCALFLTTSGGSDDDDEDHGHNHIRFFRNGTCMGHFILAKGKRMGGEAFTDLDEGVYYPAVSLYMGGSIRANFGPHLVYPPKKLPAGLTKQLRPLSEVCPVPMTAEEAVRALQTDVLKPYLHHLTSDQVQALRHAVQVEADMVVRAYETFQQNQLKWVRQEREQRGVLMNDLPNLVLVGNGDQDEGGEERATNKGYDVNAVKEE